MRKLSVNRKPLRNCASLAYRPAFGNAKGLIRLIAGLALRARVGQRQRLRKRPATILASMAARGELPVLFFGCWVSLARIPSHSSVSEAMTWQLPVINLRIGLAGASPIITLEGERPRPKPPERGAATVWAFLKRRGSEKQLPASGS